MSNLLFHRTRRPVHGGAPFLAREVVAPGRSSGLRMRLALVSLVSAASFGSSAVLAFTTPAAGSFGYDVYNTVVNDILGGPIGFVGGVFLIVWGATQLMRNWMMTIACVIAGTVLIKAVTILTSLGALV
jgi:hypothetical protein